MTRRFATSLAVLLTASLLVLACSDDDTNDTNDTANAAGGTGNNALDVVGMLGDVEDVRALVDRGVAEIDPMAIESVDYTDGVLTVRLAPGQDGQEAAELESLCNDIGASIDLPDLVVMVERADGTPAAECAT